MDALVAVNVAAVTAIALAGLDTLPGPDADALGAESAGVRIRPAAEPRRSSSSPAT